MPWLNISQAVTLEKNSSVIPGMSLETLLGRNKAWGSHDLFSEELDAVCQQTNPFLGCDYLLSYVPISHRKAWMPKPLWTVPPWAADIFDNKLKTRRWLAQAGFPIPATYTASILYWPNLPGTMVLQTLVGSCGASTYIGESDDLRKIFVQLKGDNQAIISPFLEGWVINGHVAVFSQSHIEVPWPSVQLVEFIKTSHNITRPLYAGNDFKAYDNIVRHEERINIRNNLQKIGALAAKAGYRGILGVDFLYQPESNKIYFLEINARMQGSTGLLSMIEKGTNITPITVRMFNTLLGQVVEPVEYPNTCTASPGTPVSQSIKRASVCSGHNFHVRLQTGRKYKKNKYQGIMNVSPVERRELSIHSMING